MARSMRGVSGRVRSWFRAVEARELSGPCDAAGRPVTGMAWGHRRTWQGRARSMIWLAILAAPLSGTFGQAGLGSFHDTVVVVVTVAFAVVFFALGVVPDAWEARLPMAVRLVPLVGCLAALTFLSFYDRPSWTYMYAFLIFPATSILRRPWPILLGLGVLTGVAAAGSGFSFGNSLGPVSTVCGVGISLLSFRRLSAANQALREAREDLARVAVADERVRFARDLHDLLGHSLSVITLKSEVAGRLLPASPDRAAQEVAEIEAVAREALREVRDAVTGYRQATLAVELAGARTALAAAGIAWSEDVAPLELTAAVENPLAWALREGVTNVIRHSQARTCRLSVGLAEGSATVTVTNDGVGGTRGLVLGNGLRGLSERLELAGGILEVGPAAGGGYRLRASVPRDPPTALAHREVAVDSAPTLAAAVRRS
jgi:two-component system, NarL family, sensor histidine kinase DesK